MSKKNKRYYKRQKRRKANKVKNSRVYDCHHILWQRKKWNYGYLRQLRDHYYCKIYIPRDTLHSYIHKNMIEIPVPREMDARLALWHLDYLEKFDCLGEKDPIEKRIKVLIALFDCVAQPTADALKKQLEIVREFNKKPLE